MIKDASTNITSCTIHENTKVIANDAFYNCSSLTSVTIGNGVTSIGVRSFAYCTSLTSITYNGTVAQWNAITKGDSWSYFTGFYTVYCTDGTVKK